MQTAMCRISIKTRYFLITFIVVILVGLTAVFVTYKIMKQNHTDDMPTDIRASKLTGILGDINQNDLRINAKNDICVGPSCIPCKAEVTPNIEPLGCQENNSYIKNASCFLCKHKCRTFSDLLNKSGKRISCPESVKVDCCTLSTMGRLSNYCEGGQYHCYSRKVHRVHRLSLHEPICTCPAGSHTAHCQKRYTEKAQCRCFKPKRKFCREERMTHCNNITKRWRTCYMDIIRLSETYSCICNKLKMEIDGELTECSSPETNVLGG